MVLRKYSKKGLEKRKSDRECLSDFFMFHVKKIKTEKLCCANCGDKLKADVSEVCHRLPKSTFKSIQCDDDNVTYLCSYKSSNSCHSKYDGSNEQLWSLNIFLVEKEIIKELLEKVTEKYNYKILDRWKIE
jgi:ADP-glucose pyrophosphorylase